MKKAGFSIVELIVIIIVIGLLTVIASVNYSQSRERSSVAGLEVDAKQALQKVMSFRYDNNRFPSTLAEIEQLALRPTADAYIAGDNFGICSGNQSFGVISRSLGGKYYFQTSSKPFQAYGNTSNPTSMTASPNICQNILSDSTSVPVAIWGRTASGWTNYARPE